METQRAYIYFRKLYAFVYLLTHIYVEDTHYVYQLYKRDYLTEIIFFLKFPEINRKKIAKRSKLLKTLREYIRAMWILYFLLYQFFHLLIYCTRENDE